MRKLNGDVRLIVAADEPAVFFSSIQSAESYLEAIDVNNGVYTAAYGPAGEPYRISAPNNRVSITPDPSYPAKPRELRALLVRFFAATKAPARDSEDLDALVKRCVPYLTA
jgi:hypothetical protein